MDAFSPNSARILTASMTNRQALGCSLGQPVASFAHQDGLYRAALSDGARILTASADNTAKLWDAASGKLIASFAHQDTCRGRGV